MVIADASASLRLLSHLFLISVLFDACINNLGEPVFDDVSVVILMTWYCFLLLQSFTQALVSLCIPRRTVLSPLTSTPHLSVKKQILTVSLHSHVLFCSLQVATPFITLVIFYYMAMRIDLTSQGQFGQIFSRFRFFFIASPAHLAIIAALRGGYKLVGVAPPRADAPRALTVFAAARQQHHTLYSHVDRPFFQGSFRSAKTR
jgi:hypothetical protein